MSAPKLCACGAKAVVLLCDEPLCAWHWRQSQRWERERAPALREEALRRISEEAARKEGTSK